MADTPTQPRLPGVCVLCGKRLDQEEIELLAVVSRAGYRHEYACHPGCLAAVAVPGFAGVADLSLTREEFDAKRQGVIQKFTPRARRALASTSQLAHGYGHEHIGVEHLLLALASQHAGIAADILAELGVKDEIVSRLDALLKSAAYGEGLSGSGDELDGPRA